MAQHECTSDEQKQKQQDETVVVQDTLESIHLGINLDRTVRDTTPPE
jgi:hypothetical protein